MKATPHVEQALPRHRRRVCVLATLERNKRSCPASRGRRGLQCLGHVASGCICNSRRRIPLPERKTVSRARSLHEARRIQQNAASWGRHHWGERNARQWGA
eukprot:15433299-Heterocapsa_arctica.AAC.1